MVLWVCVIQTLSDNGCLLSMWGKQWIRKYVCVYLMIILIIGTIFIKSSVEWFIFRLSFSFRFLCFHKRMLKPLLFPKQESYYNCKCLPILIITCSTWVSHLNLWHDILNQKANKKFFQSWRSYYLDFRFPWGTNQKKKDRHETNWC